MKRWVALLLAGLLAVPQGTVYAEELTDGIVEELLFDNVLDDLCVSEETEEITDEEFSEEFLDDEFYDELEEVSANSSTTTITGAYNSSKGGDIRWKKVNGASGYVLYRMRSAEGLKKVATINNPNTVQYLDGEIRDNCWGRVYTYYVRPLFNASTGAEYQSDGIGTTEGSKSNEVTLQRLAPMKITKAVSNAAGQVCLTWGCMVNANKALGYEIQYASSTSDLYNQRGSFKKILVNGRNNLSNTVTGLLRDQTYWFRIRGYVNYTHSVTGKSTKTWSQYSDVVSAKISSVVPQLKLNRSSEIIYVDDTIQLRATLTGVSGKVSWKSSNNSVATVSTDGLITAVRAGTVVISANSGNMSAKCTVIVKDPIDISSLHNKSAVQIGAMLNYKRCFNNGDTIHVYYTPTGIASDLNRFLSICYRSYSGNVTLDYSGAVDDWSCIIADKSLTCYGVKVGMTKVQVKGALDKISHWLKRQYSINDNEGTMYFLNRNNLKGVPYITFSYKNGRVATIAFIRSPDA